MDTENIQLMHYINGMKYSSVKKWRSVQEYYHNRKIFCDNSFCIKKIWCKFFWSMENILKWIFTYCRKMFFITKWRKYDVFKKIYWNYIVQKSEGKKKNNLSTLFLGQYSQWLYLSRYQSTLDDYDIERLLNYQVWFLFYWVTILQN